MSGDFLGEERFAWVCTGELAAVHESESISEEKDFVDDDGVIRMRRFFAEEERDKRNEVGGFRERSERLLCCRSREARIILSSKENG